MRAGKRRRIDLPQSRLLLNCDANAELKARALGVACEVVQIEDEHPYKATIAAAAERGCGLIAMASHGRGGLVGLVLGSETLKVLTHSTIPVLIYR